MNMYTFSLFATMQELVEWIECTWMKQLGKTCVGINWDLFSGVEQIKVSISLDLAYYILK